MNPGDQKEMPKSELLPVMPMDDVVVLPHMTVTLAVEGDAAKAAIEDANSQIRRETRLPCAIFHSPRR